MSLVEAALHAFMEQQRLPDKASLAVGVSGGADSLCLALCLAKWARKKGCCLTALTVNHGLRPESRAEAEAVRRVMRAHRIPHRILTWEGEKPRSGLEEKARDKRYELLTQACRAEEIGYLFLAHHQEDQAETFWARLSRGSGLDGLAGMPACSRRGGIVLMRPFLTVSKRDILAWAKQRELAWAEDPMNQDEAYERVRWRKRQAVLTEIGLTPAMAAKSAERLRRAQQALTRAADVFCAQGVRWEPQGYALISQALFKEQPAEIQIRALLRILESIGGAAQKIALESVEKWVRNPPARATLAGCHLIRHKRGLFIAREKRRESRCAVPVGKAVRWKQFLIAASVPVEVLERAPSPRLADVPFLVQQVFPAVKEAGVAPRFSQETDGRAEELVQKELEKKAMLHYKQRKGVCLIHFIPADKG